MAFQKTVSTDKWALINKKGKCYLAIDEAIFATAPQARVEQLVSIPDLPQNRRTQLNAQAGRWDAKELAFTRTLKFGKWTYGITKETEDYLTESGASTSTASGSSTDKTKIKK